VREHLTDAFDLPTDRVRVIVPDTGGGFGGKHSGETAVEAARLAKAVGAPVWLRWTREEEFTWAYFRPAAVVRGRGGLDADGALTAWEFETINAGGSALDTPYDVPNVTTRSLNADGPLRQGSYRALGSTANVFARESLMDELAHAVDEDPLAFRLARLSNERLRAVLEDVTERAGWNGRTRIPSLGMGLACGTEKGSYVAACVEVAVDEDGRTFRVKEIWQTFECGAIQDPANLDAQVRGCIIMGLGGALTEAMEFEDGRIVNASLHSYRVPRFADVPPMSINLLNRTDLPSVGAGETPIIAVAPAIANALVDAVGVRSRSMPLRLV
jgi:isoquinoline 1-oxidoreductase